MSEAISERQTAEANTNIAKAIYVLYLLGFVTSGVTTIIGVVMAYVYRDGAPEWLRTHYELQIRTFWMLLLYGIAAGVLMVILIGVIMSIAVAVWLIVRCVKGLKLLDERNAYPNHLTWGV